MTLSAAAPGGDRVASSSADRRLNGGAPASGSISTPYSTDAEENVLGALLLGGLPAWDQVADILGLTDFHRPDHRLIFGAIAELSSRGTPADPVTVSAYLETAGTLEEAGGFCRLSLLARNTAIAGNVRHYAEIVGECARRAALLKLGPTIESAVADGFSSAQIVDSLQSVLDALPRRGLSKLRRRSQSVPLDWHALSAQEPPPRLWWLPEWLRPDPVLTSGAGGIGKSRLWQAIGTSLATGREYLCPVLKPLRVLVWSCEEDQDEIWRVQADINRHLGLTMADLTDLHIVPRRGLDNTLLELAMGKPMVTPVYTQELYQQVNDLRIDVLVLDNIAQVYGGNENDRHQVTLFVNSIAGLVRDRPFCPVMLGHVARTQGSEFSGSAAWENAVRMRWYVGPTLPDQKPEEDEPVDPGVVYLCRRKANYTDKDWRRLRFHNGVLVPHEPQGQRFDQGSRDDDAERVVLAAMPKLVAAGLLPTDAKNGADYLPTQIVAKGYGQGHTKKDLAGAMHRLIGAGRLKREKVGTYSNRAPRMGLVIV